MKFKQALSFPSEERLKSRKAISQLFGGEGASFARHPVRLVWMPMTLDYPVQVAFSVSKRNFKKAVDRNQLRRRLRESWRLHRAPLLDTLHTLGIQIAVMVIYQGKEIHSQETLHRKTQEALHILNQKLSEGNFSGEKNVP